MILTSSYRRVAVRPFPLTEEMKAIVDGSLESIRRVIEEKKIGVYHDPEQVLWEGTILGPIGEISLKVVAKIGPFVSGTQGQAEIEEDKNEAVIRLDLLVSPFLGGYGKYLTNPDFFGHIGSLIHHELVHCLDPKSWAPSILKKMPPYVDPRETGRWEEYTQHPLETSAYGADSLYYFKAKKEKGVPIKEAISLFLGSQQSGASQAYRETMKRGDKKGWRDYLTRVYKSAEQAYRDS